MFSMRFPRLTPLAALCAAALLAPPPPQAAAKKWVLKTPVKGDRLISHMTARPAMLNPMLGHSTYESAATEPIYETLLELSSLTDNWQGRLAQSWVVDKSGLKISMKLRKGVVWSDGKPFTSKDVKFTFDKVKDPKVDAPHLRNYFESLKATAAPDPTTVVFTFSKPYYRSLIMVGLMEILPAHRYATGDFNKHPNNNKPVGTGPYLLDKFTTSELRYRPNPRWWGWKTPAYKNRYSLSSKVFRVIQNDAAALTEHKRGGLDTMSLNPKQYMRDTQGAAFAQKFQKYNYYTTYGNGYGYIAWNASPAAKLPFVDKRVRNAMSMFLDRKKILRDVYFNLAKPVTNPFGPEDTRTPKTLQPPPFNPAKAGALLAQAGIKDNNKDGLLDWQGKPFEFTLLMPSENETGMKLMQIYQAELKKAGITLNIRELEWTVFIEKVTKKEFQATMLGWGGSIESDPYQIWHSSQIAGGDNFVSFKTPRADQIMETARVTMDKKKRDALYSEFASIVAQEQPYTFLFTRPSLESVSKRYENRIVFPLGLDTSYWFTPRQKQL